ncbi:MAG TPA: hypothetical protein PLC79_08205, partial [Phycisphaerae bacterium]|nr:hypothetical protein [Phycisphaerae bacterium]
MKRPEGRRWGSCRGYHRAAWAAPWVHFERVLCEFSRDPQPAGHEYRRFVAEDIGATLASPWRDAVAGLVIGGERFVEGVRQL